MLLFYFPGACSFAEMVVLHWNGEPFRLCRLTREERGSPPYTTAVNPHGQVPAMILNGRVLTENAALLNYLADRRPELGLLPRHGTWERYVADRWLSWLDSGFHAAHVPLFKPAKFSPRPEVQRHLQEWCVREIRSVVGELDDHLRGRRHAVFAHRNVFDAYIAAMARWSRRVMDHERDAPHLHAFLRRMDEDEGVRFANAVEAGEIVAPTSTAPGFQGHVSLAEAIGMLA